MICTRCHNECKDGEKFCHICGNKLDAVSNKSTVVSSTISDETTLLEDISAEGADETTLLEAPAGFAPADSYSQTVQPTIQPPPNNPQAPSTPYRYNPKQEDNKKERIAVIAIVAIVVIVVAVLLFK